MRKNTVDLFRVDLQCQDFSNTDFSGYEGIIRGSFFHGSNFTNANLSGLTIEDSCFASCKMIGADLSNAEIYPASFELADLTNANLSGAELMDVDFNHANLTGIDFTNVDLRGCDLRGAEGEFVTFQFKHWGVVVTNVNLQLDEIYPLSDLPNDDSEDLTVWLDSKGYEKPDLLAHLIELAIDDLGADRWKN